MDDKTIRPVGPQVDGWVERSRPVRTAKEGIHTRLEPLDVAAHGASLWRAVDGHDAVWTYLAYGPFPNEAAFLDWLKGRAELADPLYFAVVDKATGRALGCITLMEQRPAVGVIEVGHIFFSPELQKTPIATEAIALAGRHVFDELGYRRFEWKCDALNAPSRAAASRYGFTFEGIFRQAVVTRGRNRDTAWYSIIDSDYPALHAAYGRWLDPANFDGQGRQIETLAEIRSRVGPA